MLVQKSKVSTDWSEPYFQGDTKCRTMPGNPASAGWKGRGPISAGVWGQTAGLLVSKFRASTQSPVGARCVNGRVVCSDPTPPNSVQAEALDEI